MVGQQLRIAMIGHRFMGKMHSHAYRMADQMMGASLKPKLAVICGRDLKATEWAKEAWGWEEASVDWKTVVEREDIDAVDIAVPSDVHYDIAATAIQAGKHVLCEKPLTNDLASAYELWQAACDAHIVHQVGFNYRRVPAVALIKRVIDEGKIGRIFHVRAQYLQDWAVSPEVPLSWRFRKEVAGSGALGDLLTHLIDLTRYLVGEFSQVSAMEQTFVADRPEVQEVIGTGIGTATSRSRRGPVTVDDATVVIAHMTNGALATFEATRFASGRKNALRMEIHGDKGAVAFDLERLNELRVHFRRHLGPCDDGFQRILVTRPDHPFMEHWWPDGHILGYDSTFAHEVYAWLSAIDTGCQADPGFGDGVRCQEVVEAIGTAITTEKATLVQRRHPRTSEKSKTTSVRERPHQA